jgi:hypothetical protein
MNQHPARISRPSPPSTTAGSRGAGLAALALAWVCASCEGASYSRLSILGASPDAGIRAPRGYGDASVGEVHVATGSGGGTGPGDLLAGAGATDPPGNPAPDAEPSVPPGSTDAPDAGGSAAPSAAGGAIGLSSGGSPGSSPATGGVGPGGAPGNAATGTQPGSGGATSTGVGLEASGGAPSASGGAPGATGGATAIGSGGATGAAAAGTGGATVPVDNARYNFETSSQLWGVATGTASFTLVERSTAQHFAGSASLAGTLSAVAGTNYFLEVAPPAPAIPVRSTITFHVYIPAAAQLSAVRCYVLNDVFTLVYTDTQTSALKRDGWTSVTVAVPATETNIIRLGVKLFSSGAWTGTVYVDSIDW